AKADGSAPPTKWQKRADDLLRAVGAKAFIRHVLHWLPLVGKKRADPPGPPVPERDATIMADRNGDVLKGLVWCCANFDEKQVAAALSTLAAACFKMIPRHGARTVKVGNACIYALTAMKGAHATERLAQLRWTVKFRAA